jgi:hypothetical protein
MTDVLMVLTMVAFVLVCVGYVSWCDRIVGNDDGLDNLIPVRVDDAREAVEVRS